MNQIEKYIEEEKWDNARKAILKELKLKKDNHWLFTRLSNTYYEEKKYKKALEISEKAIKLKPNCPLVIWDYAGSLSMLNKEIDAIKYYKKIIRKGINRIAFGECGEGLKWAKAIYADCFYRIGICYEDLGNKIKAKEYFEKHLLNRGKGIPSIYSLKEVTKKYKKLQRAI